MQKGNKDLVNLKKCNSELKFANTYNRTLLEQ